MLRREPNRVWSQKLPSSRPTLVTMICMNFEQVSFNVSPHYKIDIKEYPCHEVFGFFLLIFLFAFLSSFLPLSFLVLFFLPRNYYCLALSFILVHLSHIL